MIDRRKFIQGLAGSGLALSLPSCQWLPNRHFGRAKSFVFLHMNGGPSQMDTFDYKPELYRFSGKTVKGFVQAKGHIGGRILKPLEGFSQHGESGRWVSNTFEHMPKLVDDICVVKTVTCDSMNHYVAQMEMQTGSATPGSPHLGHWIGKERETQSELPAFFLFQDARGTLRSFPHSVGYDKTGSSAGQVEAGFVADFKRAIHEIKYNSEQARLFLEYYKKMAFSRTKQEIVLERIFRAKPLLMKIFADLRYDSRIKSLYGVERAGQNNFADQLILTRRLLEKEVPFIQVSLGNEDDPTSWDQHGNMKDFYTMVKDSDHAVAGFMQDLKDSGLLEQVVVLWGGEFGRHPVVDEEDSSAEKQGRDHSNTANSMWLAGAGIRKGAIVGETDEMSLLSVDNPVKFGDLWATALFLLGIDHQQLEISDQFFPIRLTKKTDRILTEVLS